MTVKTLHQLTENDLPEKLGRVVFTWADAPMAVYFGLARLAGGWAALIDEASRLEPAAGSVERLISTENALATLLSSLWSKGPPDTHWPVEDVKALIKYSPEAARESFEQLIGLTLGAAAAGHAAGASEA